MHMPWVRLVRINIGSLINRFSQDMSLVDMQLPVAFGITLQTFLTCIAQGVMIAIGSGYMSIAIPFCIAALYVILSFYLRTSRQIRLLVLEAKAPLYDHFLQTIDGGATIRAFRWQERFTRMNEELLDLSQKSFYALYSAQQWLQVVLDLLVAALATLLTALVLFVTNKSTSGSVVGVPEDGGGAKVRCTSSLAEVKNANSPQAPVNLGRRTGRDDLGLSLLATLTRSVYPLGTSADIC